MRFIPYLGDINVVCTQKIYLFDAKLPILKGGGGILYAKNE